VAEFLTGVIEGFYGQPWTQAERFELFDWMASWGLNTYLYAPKDDLKQRAIWRELYSVSEAETLGQLVRACQQRNIQFIYALSPGLDIRYSDETELGHLQKRFEQMLAMGCRHFALLFDDIPIARMARSSNVGFAGFSTGSRGQHDVRVDTAAASGRPFSFLSHALLRPDGGTKTGRGRLPADGREGAIAGD